MKQGYIADGDLYWLVVCQDKANPDGPASFIGPYSEQEYALCDVWLAQSPGDCRNQHYIGHQRWDSERIPKGIGDEWADYTMDWRLETYRESIARIST